jgi:hypothetical protein
MLKIMTSREIDASKMRYNTRVGTGKARHAQKIDTRTLWGRRDREIYNAIMSDLGGADRLSELEHQVVRRAVGLALQCEQIETQLAEGKPVDIAATATLINVFNRTASLLGLKRRARDVTPHLEDYISQRYSADDGGL